MTKHLHGLYASEEEAITIVSCLELKGHKAKDITIFTSLSKENELKKRTDVNVKSTVANNQDIFDNSPFNKIMKRTFNKNRKTSTPFETLQSFNLSVDQAKDYLADLESGKVLVIVDDDLRMGHLPYKN